MKVAMVSFTGKIGKSACANALAYPRMPGATMIRLETINVSGLSGAAEEKLKGRDISALELQLAKTNDAIIDVGASNIESFLLALNSQYESHLMVDYFIVPVKANRHSQIEMEEAIKTLKALSLMGVEPERIKVVFNMLPHDSTCIEECRILFNMHKKEPIFSLSEDAFIHETEAFSSLAAVKKSYVEMLADPKNYRQEISKIPMEDEKARTEMVKLIRAQGTVKILELQMQRCWTALFGEK